MRVLEHLHTGGPPPKEYLRLVLMRDVYKCTLEEFDRIPIQRILVDMNLLSIENKYRNQKQRGLRSHG